MPETSAGTYATLGGTEIVNNTRTLTYLQNGLGPASISIHCDDGHCGNCDNILELLDCPGITGYVDPISDDAPWYTPSIPESGEFLGLYVEEFTGLDSPFTRDAIESVGNGGILSRGRLSTRSMTWRGFLFGGTCCATYYGLRWLTKTLSQFDSQCSDCLGDDLELLICCPCSDDLDTQSPFRLIKSVGLIEGPLIQSQRQTVSSSCSRSGCNGSCIIEVEFTMVAGQPYLYSPPIPVYDCVALSDGTFDVVTNPDEPCPPFSCIDPMFDNPNSPFFGICTTELPPAATYESACFDLLEADLGPALYLTVPRNTWPVLEEVVPVISIINTGGLVNTGVKIGFYESSDGNPCGDLFLNPPNCAALCDELLIGPIPPDATFYIDGRTRKMSVICGDGTAFAGERITNGPWSWPAFNNFGFCMEIQFTNPTPTPPLIDPNMCVSLSLVPRSF